MIKGISFITLHTFLSLVSLRSLLYFGGIRIFLPSTFQLSDKERLVADIGGASMPLINQEELGFIAAVTMIFLLLSAGLISEYVYRENYPHEFVHKYHKILQYGFWISLLLALIIGYYFTFDIGISIAIVIYFFVTRFIVRLFTPTF